MIVRFNSYHRAVRSRFLTCLNKLVSFGLRSRYYHSSISFMVDGLEQVFEAHAPALSQRLADERECNLDPEDTIAFEIDDKFAMRVYRECQSAVGTKYDYLMVYLGFMFRLRKQRTRWSKNRLFCSEFTAEKGLSLELLPKWVQPFQVSPHWNHGLFATAKYNRGESKCV